MIRGRLLPVAAVLLLQGCGSAPDRFGENFGVNWQAGGVDVIWNQEIGESGRNFAVSEVNGFLCAANAKGELLFINPEDGSFDHSLDLGTELSAASACSRNRIAAVSTQADLIGFDTTSGEEHWRQQLSGKLLGKPFYSGGDSLLLFHSDGLVRSLSMETGIELWAIELEQSEFRLDGAFLPIVVGRNVLFGMPNGNLYLLDYENGVLQLKFRLGDRATASSVNALRNIGGAALNRGTFCASSFLGTTSCFSSSSGALQWQSDQNTGGRPAIGANALYFIDPAGALVALEIENGEQRWRIPASSSNRTALVEFSDNTVVVDNGFGGISIFDPEDGSLLGGFNATGEITTLSNFKGALLLATNSGTIAKLQLR